MSLIVSQLMPGLWRWRALPSPCARGEVSSVYCETPGAVVLVDPVLPPEGTAEHARFFKALDGDVARLGLPLVAVATCGEHARDVQALLARERARGLPPSDERAGLLRIAVSASESAVWLPSHRALAVGHASTFQARQALQRAGVSADEPLVLETHLPAQG